MSRIATGNWDAVIVTHSGFEKIPVARGTQEEFFQEHLRELALAIEQQRQEGDSRIVKALEKAKKQLESKLKELAANDKKDDGLTFEELGVDRLFVDEAHYFKNLFYVSKMTRIAGLPQTASQRAFDMFLKVRHVQRTNGGAGVVFATGTPIANSVAEMFTMQRFLQMMTLKTQNVAHFDSWAATFGEPVTAMELAPDGSGYRVHTRFARFINVPELMQMFRQVTDLQTQAMLKLPLPDLRGGRPTVISAPCSPELRGIVQSLVERADALKTGESDLRRLEDIDGTALTYAEVEAIASGNPMVIEKARIDAEVARLSRLHCEHQETRFKLRSRVRHLTEEWPRLEKRLEDIHRDLATRQDTSGDRFVMVLEGQQIHDRGLAGELLLRCAERLRGTQRDRLVGGIAGFQVFVADNLMLGPEIVLKGATTYTAKVTDTAPGTIRSVEHTIQHLEDVAETLAGNIADRRKRLADSQAQVDAPFEYAARLTSLVQRQQEIEGELDLTKNQAPSRLEADTVDGPPADAKEVEEPVEA